jgi:hypothetical protein
MSVFIVSMPEAGLIESPPESNTMPFPTKATVLVVDLHGHGIVQSNGNLRNGGGRLVLRRPVHEIPRKYDA